MGKQKPNEGFILIAVLAASLLLAVVVVGQVSQARTQARIARNVVAAAQAEALADGAVQLTAYLLLTSSPSLPGLGQVRPVTFEIEGAWLTVSVTDESGKVDLNRASQDMLGRLFASLDASGPQMAAAVVDFRDTDSVQRPDGGEDDRYIGTGRLAGSLDAPLLSVDDLRQVLGVTNEFFARVAPLVTVAARQVDVNVSAAPEAVLRALPYLLPQQVDEMLSSRERLATNGAPRLWNFPAQVVATVELSSGARFTRVVTMRGVEGIPQGFRIEGSQRQ